MLIQFILLIVVIFVHYFLVFFIINYMLLVFVKVRLINLVCQIFLNQNLFHIIFLCHVCLIRNFNFFVWLNKSFFLWIFYSYLNYFMIVCFNHKYLKNFIIFCLDLKSFSRQGNYLRLLTFSLYLHKLYFFCVINYLQNT